MKPTLTTVLLALAVAAVAAGDGPVERPREELSERLLVKESSILLQRVDRTRAENVRLTIDGSAAESLAVYPVLEVGLPTVLFFDLCTDSYSRLLHAVAMVVAASEPLLRTGPVSVIATGKTGGEVLLERSTDALSLEAALAVVLRRPTGDCAEDEGSTFLDRLRDGLDALADPSTAPSLLIAYGVDHQALGADDVERLEPRFAAAGDELAAEGRTTIVLLPEEGDTKLEEEEVRPLLGEPEDPHNVINLADLIGWLFFRKYIVPNDSRIIGLALDPRNQLVRKLTAPGRGRVFAFPRQLEAFSLGLRDYHVLFYRSTLPAAAREDGKIAAVEVRMRRSGDLVPTAQVVGLGGVDASARPDP